MAAAVPSSILTTVILLDVLVPNDTRSRDKVTAEIARLEVTMSREEERAKVGTDRKSLDETLMTTQLPPVAELT